jgi:hypothetical protein
MCSLRWSTGNDERRTAVGLVEKRDTDGPISPEAEAGGVEAAEDEATGAEAAGVETVAAAGARRAL